MQVLWVKRKDNGERQLIWLHKFSRHYHEKIEGETPFNKDPHEPQRIVIDPILAVIEKAEKLKKEAEKVEEDLEVDVDIEVQLKEEKMFLLRSRAKKLGLVVDRKTKKPELVKMLLRAIQKKNIISEENQ